ncbi:hypothetical protein FHG71_10970 [Rubellimicrobium roseum]|uniref:Uncharacterized protein n=1 Tax=Rubellimicrobium roseum TaxID=687525 RepID=A0A5C4NCA0_9RHOB|nr:hypothetical protein FHG71_10970 [Rubellimicrobium roseum]
MTKAVYNILPNEPIDGEERLLKALHHTDYHNGKINSLAFFPSEEHNFKLSVDRAKLSTPKETYDRYVKGGEQSSGVCGVHASDFVNEEIQCSTDPSDDNVAHSLADFSPHGVSQRRKKARRLAAIAVNYGLDYSNIAADD